MKDIKLLSCNKTSDNDYYIITIDNMYRHWIFDYHIKSNNAYENISISTVKPRIVKVSIDTLTLCDSEFVDYIKCVALTYEENKHVLTLLKSVLIVLKAS